MKNPENREENPQNPLDRIKEIDELFRSRKFMTIEDQNKQEITWAEGEDARQLLVEKEEILKSNSSNPDFSMAYAAYMAPIEGKKTAEQHEFREMEKERVMQNIQELEESLRKAKAYLKRLENE